MDSSVMVGMGSAAVLLLSSIAIAFVSRSAARGNLPRNHSVGIRTRATLASDEAWLAGHKAAGPRMRIGAIGAVALSALACASGLVNLAGVEEGVANIIVGAGIMVSATWLISWMLAATKTANRAAQSASV